MYGVTLADVYQQARFSLLKVRDGLERLERLEWPSSSVSSPRDGVISVSELAQSVQRELGVLKNSCGELDRLWRMQVAKAQRDLWKRKVEQIMEEGESLRIALEKYIGRQQRRQVEAQEREELLSRANGDSVLNIYDDHQAIESLTRSSNMLEDALSTGLEILTKYSVQREHLKNAQRKALDVLTRVGLSNSVLRVIERRHRIDKWISYMGMVIVVVVVLGLWIWVR